MLNYATYICCSCK